MPGTGSPTPLRRGPIYAAAAALVLGGLVASDGRVPLAAAALAVAALLAARRLRGARRRYGVAFGATALVLAGAAAAELVPDLADYPPFAGLFASIVGFIVYVAAVRADERWREESILELSLPLRELLARRGFGRERHERCVEVPWVLGRAGAARRILEVGHAKAEPFYLDALLRKLLPDARVFGLDLVAKRVARVTAVAGDARRAPFRGGAFDLVLCVSTIEHVGRDVSRWGARAAADGREGMLAAAAELGRLVAPGGRFLLTVPFGRAAEHGWLANLSRADLSEIEARSGLVVAAEDFFAYDDGWHPAAPGELAGRDYATVGALGASAIACVELRRPAAAD